MNYKAWMQRAAEFMELGAEKFEDGYDPEKQKANGPKLLRIAEEFILAYDKNNGTNYQSAILSAGDSKTLYLTLKKHTPVTILLMLNGTIKPADVMDLTEKGVVDVLKTYDFPLDGGIECVEAFKKLCEQTRKVQAAGLSGSTLCLPPEKDRKLINTMLKDVDFPPLEDIVSSLTEFKGMEQAKTEAEKVLQRETKKFEEEISRLRTAASFVQQQARPEFKVESDGTIPNGEVVWKKASEVFTTVTLPVDFDVPVFEWDGVHPYVPAVDPNYIFREGQLSDTLFALVSNQRGYLQGDTGSGKTTLLEQVAAYLNFPFIRINFDSEITRADLIGQHVLETDDKGNTVSRFVEGLLPQAMSQPCIACFDELDFVRPDVAYVMQAATEGNGLKLMEDGGREVRPHEMFRMFATGNTVGQGDEEGRYQGARPQSLALLDRFTVWVQVPYLEADQREKLLMDACPMLTADESRMILQYTEEHLTAFQQGKVHQPLSPRGIISIGKATNTFQDVQKAVSMCVLNRATGDDRAVLIEILNRVS